MTLAVAEQIVLPGRFRIEQEIGRGGMAVVYCTGAAEAMQRDLRRELEELLQQAEDKDPFAHYYLTRTLADQIVIICAALGEWHQAMDWVERAWQRRPVRLRRMLTEPPFDRRGLAVDPRYARLLRAAVMEDLL